MKHILQHINKAFESRVRLGIMSILVVNHEVDFNTMKEQLEVSDGNLASHIAALEREKYIKIHKQFLGKKPNTSYSATAAGKKAFASHVDALEKLIRNS